jgi:hypothetical protein
LSLYRQLTLKGGSQKEVSQPVRTKPTIRIKRLNFEGTRLIPIQRQQPQDPRPWSLAAIVDELVISMLDTTAVFCMINSNKKTTMFSDPKEVEVNNRCNSGNGVLRRLYEEQARYKMYRIPVFRPPPIFIVYLKHLDDRLKKELTNLDRETKDFVMKEAIGRICEQVDKRFFLLSVKPLLRWRLE